MDSRLHIYYEEQVDFEKVRQSFIERYMKIMEEMNLDGIFVSRIENVQSLTRWRAPFGRNHYVMKYGAMIDKRGKVIFLTRPGDTMKVEAVMPWLKDIRVIPDMAHDVVGKKGSWAGVIEEVCKDCNISKRLGIDLITLKVLYTLNKDMPQLEIVDVDDAILKMRMIKTDDEIKIMRMAVDVAEKSLEAGLAIADYGIKECDISAKIAEVAMKDDIEGLHLTPHVITGPHSAYKYRHHTDRRIRFGDIIRIDSGVIYAGYCGEYNRTTIAGRPSPKQREIAQVVYEGHTKAIEAIRPGATCREIDAIPRKLFEEKGYGKYAYRYPTGHGLGMSVHEMPSISQSWVIELKPGMVINIEPGIIYFDDPNIGGVTFEDIVLVTEDGHEILTRTEYCSKLLGFNACPMGKY